MHGLRAGRLEFSPYDDRWAEEFARESIRIRGALGERCGGVWHIGSTAVPGLMAKPVIDIAMDFQDAEQLWHIVHGMQRLGYSFGCVHEEANHWYFRFDRDGKRLFQVHLWPEGDPGLRNHISFARILRIRRDLRDEYAANKQKWAEQSGWHKLGYTECKGEFVRRVLDEGSAGDRCDKDER